MNYQRVNDFMLGLSTGFWVGVTAAWLWVKWVP